MKTKLINKLLLSFCFLFLFSCQDKQAIEELEACKAQMEIEKQNKAIVQRYWEGKWNDRNPEILEQFLTQDIINHGSDDINGIEEYKQVYAMLLASSSETKINIEGLMAEGDLVMSRIQLQGINSGQLGEMPPSGNKFSFRIFTVFRLVDGKIAEEWEIYDELAFMMQIGLELK